MIIIVIIMYQAIKLRIKREIIAIIKMIKEDFRVGIIIPQIIIWIPIHLVSLPILPHGIFFIISMVIIVLPVVYQIRLDQFTELTRLQVLVLILIPLFDFLNLVKELAVLLEVLVHNPATRKSEVNWTHDTVFTVVNPVTRYALDRLRQVIIALEEVGVLVPQQKVLENAH